MQHMLHLLLVCPTVLRQAFHRHQMQNVAEPMGWQRLDPCARIGPGGGITKKRQTTRHVMTDSSRASKSQCSRVRTLMIAIARSTVPRPDNVVMSDVAVHNSDLRKSEGPTTLSMHFIAMCTDRKACGRREGRPMSVAKSIALTMRCQPQW